MRRRSHARLLGLARFIPYCRKARKAFMPSVTGILETCLPVVDLPRSIEFYRSLFSWPVLASDSRFAALAVADKQVLLLFLQGASEHEMPIAGGIIPGHGGAGRLHLA